MHIHGVPSERSEPNTELNSAKANRSAPTSVKAIHHTTSRAFKEQANLSMDELSKAQHQLAFHTHDDERREELKAFDDTKAKR
ncbi:hypothetical protein Syun_022617 [Stephania yunnanensis]|uniref:Uncharacterized protein n=1 Tax=Stephania yunnanensis TaxID=152371 RepID=A0AAP0I2W4_9MAGN